MVTLHLHRVGVVAAMSLSSGLALGEPAAPATTAAPATAEAPSPATTAPAASAPATSDAGPTPAEPHNARESKANGQQAPRSTQKENDASSEPEGVVGTAVEARLPKPPLNAARVHHAPVIAATSGRDLQIHIDIDYPHTVAKALLVYGTRVNPKSREVEFKRGVTSPYIAVIPAKDVQGPWVDYRVELETLNGTRLAAFASEQDMHRVQTAESIEDVRERALAKRLDQRRSQFFATSEYVDFGQSDAIVDVALANGAIVGEQRSVRDRYVRIESGYTYRPLRTVLEFSLRAGIVRGQSPVPTGELAPGQNENERFEVGLNYGAPTARLRLGEQLHADVELLASVTEVGFSVGAGGALIAGDPFGSSLTAGFETIQIFGTRFYTRLNTVIADGVELAPIIEITDMPHASRYGVRLLGETSFDLGSGFEVAARGGYQARTFTAGGPSAGVSVGYGF